MTPAAHAGVSAPTAHAAAHIPLALFGLEDLSTPLVKSVDFLVHTVPLLVFSDSQLPPLGLHALQHCALFCDDSIAPFRKTLK